MSVHQIRLVAIDLDGTLLRPDRTISASVREAVAETSRRARVIIATARPPRSMRSFVRELDLGSDHVVYNGAATWDFDVDRVRSHLPLSRPVVADSIDVARSLVPMCAVDLECLDRWFTDRVDPRYVTETGRLFRPDAVAPLATFAGVETTKLMIHADAGQIDAIRPVLEAATAGRALWLRTDPDLLQAINPVAGKWAAIVAIADRLGIGREGILTIGDNENDVEMLRKAGVGVAIASGTDAARRAADWIAPSNRDDGVAIALDRFVNVD